MILLVLRVFVFLNFLEITYAKTCNERLKKLENILHSLQLRLDDRAFENSGLGNSEQDALKMKLTIENQDLERRVVVLEEALTDSNRQIYLLQARVSELEHKTQEQEARLGTVERNTFVSEMKAPDVDRKTVKETNEIDFTNEFEARDTSPNVFANSPSKGNTITQTNKETPTTKTKYKVPIQRYSRMDDARNLWVENHPSSGLHTRQTPFPGGVAFSAYVSKYETDISKDHLIRFDRIVTNIGNYYNPNSGTFTAPQHGVYVFTWNLYCSNGGYIYSQVVVNSNVVGAMFTTDQGAVNVRGTTGIVVVEVNQGDVVFVRTHPIADHGGNLYSSLNWRSSFNGWKLF